jgi:hypothetical protein
MSLMCLNIQYSIAPQGVRFWPSHPRGCNDRKGDIYYNIVQWKVETVLYDSTFCFCQSSYTVCTVYSNREESEDLDSLDSYWKTNGSIDLKLLLIFSISSRSSKNKTVLN